MNISNTKYLLQLAKEKLLHSSKTSATKYAFVHIPKTAGNSVIKTIYDNVGQAKIYPNYYEKVIVNKGHYIDNALLRSQHHILLANKSWLIGHFPIGLPKSIWPEVKTLCFFRNPTDRIVSNILHFKEKTDEYSRLTLLEIFDKVGLPLTFQQARLMGYSSEKDNRKQVEHIIKSLDYIGITEQYSRSMSMLGKQMNWCIEHNITNKSMYEDSDIALLRQKLEHLDIIDNFVYAFAQTEFERRAKLLGI